MRSRRSEIRCSACGRLMSKGSAVECLSCLRLFHGSCVRRVRRFKDGRLCRPSYNMCRACLDDADKDLDRVLLAQRGVVEHG